MPTAFSGVQVRAGLYFVVTSRWRGSSGVATGAPRYTSPRPSTRYCASNTMSCTCVDVVEAVDAADELDVVGAPRRVGPDAVHVALRSPRASRDRPRTAAAARCGWVRRVDPTRGSSPSTRASRSTTSAIGSTTGSNCTCSERTPGVSSMIPGRRAATRCSCSTWTRARIARSSVIGPYSTSTPSSPARRSVTAVPSAAAKRREHAVVAVAGRRDHRGERRAPVDVDGAQRRCPVGAHRHEPHGVAGRQLAELPPVAADDGDRADEAAEARPVRAEQDRRVAGEVKRANAVGVVVDVRRVQPGLAAVGAGPLRLRPVEPHAGAVGVEVHGVVGADERVDVGAGEELGRAVRTLGDGDLPAVADAGLLVDRGAGGPVRPHLVRAGILADGQRVALAQRAAVVAAERAQRERRRAAKVFGFDESAGDQHVAPHARSAEHADVEHATGGHVDRLPLRHGDAVDRHRHRRAGHAHPSARRGSATQARPWCIRAPRRPRRFRAPGCRCRNDRSSIGPDGGTPMCQKPIRPGQSWTVVSMPWPQVPRWS